MRSYMSERKLLVENNGVPNAKDVTCGIPQGSVLGHTLWNLFYDGLLKLDLPRDTQLVTFADDVAVVAVARNDALLEVTANAALDAVSARMRDNGLRIAPHKS